MSQTVQPARAEPNEPRLPCRSARIVVIASSWHRDLVENCTSEVRSELVRSEVAPEQIEFLQVPGAFEIPLHAMRLARSGRYQAIIACGLIVNGGIYRHEFVAAAVIDGLMRVQLDTGVPVFSAVLTPWDFHEHEDHHRFYGDHLRKKGIEVAQACMSALASLDSIRGDGGIGADRDRHSGQALQAHVVTQSQRVPFF